MTKDLKIYNIAVDIVLFGVTVTILSLFYYTLVEGFPLKERGFNCKDSSIQYLYEGDTISTQVLFGAIFAPPIGLFILGEVLYYVYRTRQRDSKRYVCQSCRIAIHPIIVSIYQKVGLYLFGAALKFLFVLLGKRMGGRLRPHFLDTCKPDYSLFNCSDRLIEGDVCTGDDKEIQDARESFPSGHAALAFYSMVFSAMYIEARLRWRSARLVKPFLQGWLLLIAFACALSRVYDNRHHPSDVIWGSIIGILLAYFMVYIVSDLFKDKQSGEPEERDVEVKETRFYKQNFFRRPRKTRRTYDEERYL
ncbi:phospholipid phosphatase 3-like [Ptychodera flava]|uniref:phospholipid phosphatase 3-like n=1 Tax=Ptychodera flava TaxID=63121 RepID=UPI00396A1AC7